MRKEKMLSRIKEHVVERKFIYGLLSLCLLCGIIVGVIYSFTINMEETSNISDAITTFFGALGEEAPSVMSVFRASFFSNARLFIILALLGLHYMLVPIEFAVIGCKGFPIGFTLSFMIINFKARGLLLGLIALLPQMLILMPLIFYYTTVSIDFAWEGRRSRNKSKYRNFSVDAYRSYFMKVMMGIVLLCGIGLIDSMVIPVFMREMAKLF